MNWCATRSRRWLLATLATLVPCFHNSLAADWPPADHGGADVVPVDGDSIWGMHTGIGTFRITSGSLVYVRPYDGQDTFTGTLEVHAQRVEVEGTLDATGAGYTGGGGGGGGGGCMQPCFGQFIPGGFGGGGPGCAQYACAADTASSGTSASVYKFGIVSWACSSGSGGAAGGGDGPFGGAPGSTDTRHRGGYGAPETNGDTSMDNSTSMGSGSGGMAGGDGACGLAPGGGGGAGGGCGGGTIRLFAAQGFRLTAWGVIAADGALGRSGFPPSTTAGRGGDSVRLNPGNWFQYGVGTGGAGGGILLDLASVTDLLVEAGAWIHSLGGGAEPENGGTVKIFRPMAGSPSGNPEISAGRSFIADPTPAQGWELYE